MTAISRARKPAALGVRCHSGWAATVLLATDDGNSVELVDRSRFELCDPNREGSKQPFHHAETLAFAEAEAFIAQSGRTTATLSNKAIAALLEQAVTNKLKLTGCALLVTASRELPPLEKVLASHALIHTAEGMFYREAIAIAAERLRVRIMRVRESEALRQASDRSGKSEAELRAALMEIGKTVGPPWTVDQKLATLAAWSLLAVRS